MIQIIKTNDGSDTISHTQSTETYHSKYGALNESVHVFIKEGLHQFQSTAQVSIFECGFGTGLNTLLTYLYKPQHQTISYTTIERYPLEEEMWSLLNYSSLLNISNSTFSSLHTAIWNQTTWISSEFKLNKIKEDIRSYSHNGNNFDLIYFDAFSPRSHPDLWSKDIFQTMFDTLNKSGCLVTYCAKGDIKRRLADVGFKVITCDGPPGKREMIRAVK